MFGPNKVDYKAQVERLSLDVTALTADKLALEKRLEEAQDIIESAAIAKATLEAQVADHNDMLATIKQAHNKEIKNLESSINRKLVNTLASVGVHTFASETFSVSKDTTDLECYQKFQSLEGQAKTEYYSKHKAQITRALLP